MFDIRKPMSASEWRKLEDYYISELQAIAIPEDASTVELREINARLSRLYSQARFDYAFVKRQYERVKRQLKRAEREAYLAVKDSGKNEKEREALVQKYLEENKLYGYPVNLYDALDICEERVLFLEAVMDELKDRHERMITLNALLKLEQGIG